MKKFILLLILPIFGISTLQAQFDISAYKDYLKSHKNMSVDQLLTEYPAGLFYQDAFADIQKSHYGDSVIQKFSLTDYEQNLISSHGFMVTERVSYPTFLQAYRDIFNKDVPAYISADAILHALHFSFDRILADFEENRIRIQLDSALRLMKAELPNQFVNDAPEVYSNALNDLDVYLTVTKNLLTSNSKCTYPENEKRVSDIMKLIESCSYAELPLFSSTPRQMDFSQFTPRGHYTKSIRLTKYFLAMMWLGRTEFYITNPKNAQDPEQTKKDLHRMAIFSALITQTAKESGAYILLEKIETFLSFMLGTQDNISVFNASDALDELSYTAFDICDTLKYAAYTDKLSTFSSANQLYNSQIIMSDPNNPNQVELPTVFLMMGQRPIIDGYITANVVYDRIMFKYEKVMRMVPSTLDVLFALGNDAAIQLLKPELQRFPYASNLAALRYLIDSYDNDFWESSIYTNWLTAIRSLNPPLERKNLPNFMKTAAWQQKSMNTQLASWAELRHDFILYAKQPYTSDWMCSFPYSFVEPVPEFFNKIKQFFVSLKEVSTIEETDYLDLGKFCDNWIAKSEKLLTLSEKSLNNIEYTEEERQFVNDMVSFGGGICQYDNPLRMGWYPELYYGMTTTSFYSYINGTMGGILEDDRHIVADVHTIPTDESGNQVGWVLHAGTGNVNLAVITTEKPGGGQRTYTGAVSSYYEFLSNDFKRVTDEEWREMNIEPNLRPTFTSLYLANSEGKQPGTPVSSLFTILSSVPDEPTDAKPQFKVSCYPNPATGNIYISFDLYEPENNVKLEVYDLTGNLVKRLINENLSANNYVFVWDVLSMENKRLASGTYIISLKIGEDVISEKVIVQ